MDRNNVANALLIIVCLVVLSRSASADSEGSIRDTRTLSLLYLRNMPDSKKVYVWPSRTRNYEILGNKSEIFRVVNNYISDRSELFEMNAAIGVAQISILYGNFEDSSVQVKKLMNESKLLPWYKTFSYGASLSEDGCTAYRFMSRKTWLAVGLIFVDQRKFGVGSEIHRDLCISGALDYVNGFPTKEDYFNYLSLPSEPVREMILKAADECSNEGSGEQQQMERSRDGITPLPSLQCVFRKTKG